MAFAINNVGEPIFAHYAGSGDALFSNLYHASALTGLGTAGVLPATTGVLPTTAGIIPTTTGINLATPLVQPVATTNPLLSRGAALPAVNSVATTVPFGTVAATVGPNTYYRSAPGTFVPLTAGTVPYTGPVGLGISPYLSPYSYGYPTAYPYRGYVGPECGLYGGCRAYPHTNDCRSCVVAKGGSTHCANQVCGFHI